MLHIARCGGDKILLISIVLWGLYESHPFVFKKWYGLDDKMWVSHEISIKDDKIFSRCFRQSIIYVTRLRMLIGWTPNIADM